MIYARFPELFNGFDNNSLGNHGDNCASFQANIEEASRLEREGTLAARGGGGAPRGGVGGGRG